MDFKEKPYYSIPIYQGKIINVKKKYVHLPNDQISIREVVEHSGGVGILAITKYKEIILVKQYRSPIEDSIYEIPAGKLEIGENPLTCAKRELREETGFDAKEFNFIGKVYPSPGYTNEIIYLYQANELFESPLETEDLDENLTISFLPINEINSFIAQSNIMDAKTIIALYHFLLKNNTPN